MKRLFVGFALLVMLGHGAAPLRAEVIDSLWLGTDNINIRNVLNTDTAGNLLRFIGPLEATGFAVDPINNLVYFGDSQGVITPRNRTTLVPGMPFSPSNPGTGLAEDMTFDGSSIWRVTATGDVLRINPTTHQSSVVFNLPYESNGVAWDAGTLLISDFITGDINRYQTNGSFLGKLFTVPFNAGGLGLDTTDNTLFIGGALGTVYHYTLGGTQLGSFKVPPNQAPERFLDGLEFDPGPPATAVPEPASLALILLGTCGLAGYGWRRRKG
jgi:hypothetical protein